MTTREPACSLAMRAAVLGNANWHPQMLQIGLLGVNGLLRGLLESRDLDFVLSEWPSACGLLVHTHACTWTVKSRRHSMNSVARHGAAAISPLPSVRLLHRSRLYACVAT